MSLSWYPLQKFFTQVPPLLCFREGAALLSTTAHPPTYPHPSLPNTSLFPGASSLSTVLGIFSPSEARKDSQLLYMCLGPWIDQTPGIWNQWGYKKDQRARLPQHMWVELPPLPSDRPWHLKLSSPPSSPHAYAWSHCQHCSMGGFLGEILNIWHQCAQPFCQSYLCGSGLWLGFVSILPIAEKAFPPHSWGRFNCQSTRYSIW